MSAAASETPAVTPHTGTPRRIRVVTAASLFDGHDAAINIMRRVLQSLGAEVIHLGHDRSVEEIAQACVHEDADAVAVSSYQGGHMEFFGYLVERLAVLGVPHVRVYGGGGGTITAEEARALEAGGVARIFRPEDGRSLGLEGMIRVIVDECAEAPPRPLGDALERLRRFGAVIHEAVQLTVERDPAGACVALAAHPALDALRHPVDARLALLR